jgi:hypothetical protein
LGWFILTQINKDFPEKSPIKVSFFLKLYLDKVNAQVWAIAGWPKNAIIRANSLISREENSYSWARYDGSPSISNNQREKA